MIGLVIPVDGRRDRKKRQTRDDLIEAAALLFSTVGFDETTTVDVAEAADVSQRTLFRHFPSKEALLYGDMDEVHELLRQVLAVPSPSTPITEVVAGAMQAIAEEFDRHRDRRLMQIRLAASTPSVSAYSRAVLQASWEREIIAAVAARLGVDPVDDPRPEILAGASMSALRVATRQWTAAGGRGSFVDIANEAFAPIASLAGAAPAVRS